MGECTYLAHTWGMIHVKESWVMSMTLRHGFDAAAAIALQ